MSQRHLTFCLLLAAITSTSVPCAAWARGGGGGGYAGGGHAGGGFAGGHGGGYGGGSGGRGWGGNGYHAWGGRGHGWGYRGHGWGYPYYGLGLGVGLGYGIGYGLSGGYGYYGYPAYAYGGYGYAYPAYGYGYYGYDPYDTGYVAGYVAGNDTATSSASSTAKGGPSTGATAMPIVPNPPQHEARAPNAASQPFVDQGEAAFRSGDYADAVQALRHASVDDPHNGLIALMLGQALFASGNYEESAGATQAAMRQLPKEQWGVIIAHYEELYGKRQAYTDQLHALEQAIQRKPKEPALRFLAGFHYAYLGFTTEAVDQLEAGLKLAPRDEMARQLRNEMRAKLAHPTRPPAPLLPGLPPVADDADDK